MLAFILPSLFVGLPLLGWWLELPWLGLAAGALVVPAGEWLIGGRTLGPGLRSVWLMRLLMAAVIVQIPLLALLSSGSPWITTMPRQALEGWDLLALALSVGYVSGGIGIVLAHELGHRRGGIDIALSRLLLVLVLWGPYRTEHNRGHHRRAATPDDPASARAEESLFRFMLRYFPGVYRCGFALHARAGEHPMNALRSEGEQGRVSAGTSPRTSEGTRPRTSAGTRSWTSEAAILTAASILAILLLAWLGGRQAAIFLLIQSAVALYLVCAVDYVEHWGLQRARKGNSWERIGARHTWDCANGLSDVLLFHLPRHAHHHMEPSLPAHALERTSASPQMPTGYAGMVVLASIPPLWFAVMRPRLAACRGSVLQAP